MIMTILFDELSSILDSQFSGWSSSDIEALAGRNNVIRDLNSNAASINEGSTFLEPVKVARSAVWLVIGSARELLIVLWLWMLIVNC